MPILTIYAVMLLFNCLASTCSIDTDRMKTITSCYMESPNQSNWDSEKWNTNNCLTITGDTERSENVMQIYSLWSQDSLYFFYKVTDTDLRTYQVEQDHSKLYLDDMVEVLIDTQNDKDSCWSTDDIIYHVNLFKVKKDDRGSLDCITEPTWNGNAVIQLEIFGTLNDTTDIDKGYLMTLSFPWDEIQQQPKVGLQMGINFANGDNDGKGRQLYDWVGAWPMRSPYSFGNLVLEGNERLSKQR